MLRKCRHVCVLIQSRMEWFGRQLVQEPYGFYGLVDVEGYFQQIQWNVVDVDKEIGVALVHTLKGEYDAIKGDSDVVSRKQ